MKKFLILLALVFVTLSSTAQTTCMKVLRVELYKYNIFKEDFDLVDKRYSDLELCMSLNHLEIDNQNNTYAVFKKTVLNEVKNGVHMVQYEAYDKYNHHLYNILVTHSPNTSTPGMKFVVSVLDHNTNYLVYYYMNL